MALCYISRQERCMFNLRKAVVKGRVALSIQEADFFSPFPATAQVVLSHRHLKRISFEIKSDSVLMNFNLALEWECAVGKSNCKLYAKR